MEFAVGGLHGSHVATGEQGQQTAANDGLGRDSVDHKQKHSRTNKKASSAHKMQKKSPDAPKRFSSAFLLFFIGNKKQLRKKLESKNPKVKATDMSKLASEEWKKMSAGERQVWERLAEMDKERYEIEKVLYQGPWTVPIKKRAKKDPNAPKRPMSAFLAYGNCRRAKVKRQNPGFSNDDLSKKLAAMWKVESKQVKEYYIQKEAKEREEYKAAMEEWRKEQEQEEIKSGASQEREAAATLQNVAERMQLKTDNEVFETLISATAEVERAPPPIQSQHMMPMTPAIAGRPGQAQDTPWMGHSVENMVAGQHPMPAGMPIGGHLFSSQKCGPFLPAPQETKGVASFPQDPDYNSLLAYLAGQCDDGAGVAQGSVVQNGTSQFPQSSGALYHAGGCYDYSLPAPDGAPFLQIQRMLAGGPSTLGDALTGVQEHGTNNQMIAAGVGIPLFGLPHETCFGQRPFLRQEERVFAQQPDALAQRPMAPTPQARNGFADVMWKAGYSQQGHKYNPS